MMRKVIMHRLEAWLARRWAWLAALAAISSGSFATAAPTVLNFEDIAPGTTITTQYAARGVLFSGAFLGLDAAAHSGTRVLRTVSPGIEVFDPIPIVMNFTSPQSRVKLFAGHTGETLNGTLRAFDANGAVIAHDGPKPVTPGGFPTMFEVMTPTARIMRAEMQIESRAHHAIDDLEFDGEPPTPLPTQPPVVQIVSPAHGADLDVDKLDINGTVTGEGLLSPVNVTIAYQQPPESTAPLLNLFLPLPGAGTNRQFMLPGGFTGTPLGRITLTVTASNIGGLKGTATSTINNMPAAIRNRFDAEGGAATFGAFRFALSTGGCKIAVYEQGAIAGAGPETRLIRGDIFAKWLSLRTPFNRNGLGCPLGEERDGLGGTRVQDFERGRIYARLAIAPGTAYVPTVFVDAMDKRGGEEANGLPLADPTDSIGPSKTWLFQRFFRPEERDMQPSTLEIRGTPPMLWMERQGGAWFISQLAPSDADRALHKSAATLWEKFPCSGSLGPCSVEVEPPFPPPNLPNAGDLFCDGTTYNPVIPGRPPEWVGIRGNYVATPVFGAIVSAHMTDIDNGLTHETHNGNCPGFPNILQALSTLTCVSDYEFFVRPIGPQVDTTPLPSLFGKKNVQNIKTEYEVAYAAAAHNFLGVPQRGDLVHTTGRWIIDCGHDTYKSELHPIFSFATMKTVVSETNSFTGLEEVLFGGKHATRVAIWINGWYPGGDGNAIEFDVFPPPRPSPNSVLRVVKPLDFAAGGYRAAEDVTLQFSLVPQEAPSHVHLKFTSPRRENVVTGAGEMLFAPGRQYWGKWYLYWD